MTTVDYSDTSRWSHHVDDVWYDRLVQFVETLGQDWPAPDPATRAWAESYLYTEARYVDEGRFNDWMDLFTDDCLYWVPITPGSGDPRREVSHAFDDRRRLTDRVHWLRTGLAYCQIPRSRTRRSIANVEVFDDPSTGLRFTRSNVLIAEFRAGTTKLYAGWCGHVLRAEGDGWQIVLKQTNLLDSEHGHENLTLVL